MAALPATAQEAAIDGAELRLLAAPDLSSPRATLQTLRESLDEVYEILDETFDQYREEPGFVASPEVRKKITRADLLLRRAVATLDLSQLPPLNRRRAGTETALLLKEILDRLPESLPEDAPDAGQVKAEGLTGWTYPFSEIRIGRVADGPRAGEFLFTAGTVARAPEFYDAVQSYAQRPDARSDLYRFYTLTPGDLLPPKWYLWIEELPRWAQVNTILGEAPWQWAAMILTLVVLFGGWWAIWRLGRGRGQSPSPLRRSLFRLLMPALLIAACFAAEWVISDQINISGTPLFIVGTVIYVIAYLSAAWVAYVLCVGFAEWIVASPRINPAGLDASLIRIVARIVGIGASIAIIFAGATEIGLPLYGVLAGLGVGGLALGLAARPTLENLIGGLILYADRPVRVGDYCEFGSKRGTVEAIGLRSTRIRATDRTLVTVPNAEFSNMEIINHTRRDQTLLHTTIGLRYETTREQIRQILDSIRTLLAENPAIVGDTIRVRFVGLGNYSLNIEVRAYVDRPGYTEFLEVQEEVLLAIMKVIDDCGAAIAFPSQTTYHVYPGAAPPPAPPPTPAPIAT